MVNQYNDCEYLAFISYAHADDKATNGWISSFCEELQQVMEGKLSNLPEGSKALHLSQDDGPINGVLDPQLQNRIKNSFFTIVIIYDAYLISDYCLKEIKWFKEIHGGTGYTDRLFILSLSERAIEAAKNSEIWKYLSPDTHEQVYLPCYNNKDKQQPIPQYRNNDKVTTEFGNLIQKIATKMSDKIKQDNNVSKALKPVQTIPNKKNLGDKRFIVALGYVSDELSQARDNIQKTLESVSNIDVIKIGLNSFIHGSLSEDLAYADYLILPYNQSSPLLPQNSGGHIAIQYDAWKKSKNETSIFAINMESQYPAQKRCNHKHASYLSRLNKKSVQIEYVYSTLNKACTKITKSDKEKFVIFIESNPRHLRLWRMIARRIATLWKDIAEENPNLSLPKLRCKALPVDSIDDSLKIYEGNIAFILLWSETNDIKVTKKTIEKCEHILPDDNILAPGIIAYVTPPLKELATPQSADGWDIVRFRKSQQPTITEAIEEEREEKEIIRDFLLEIITQSSRAVICTDNVAIA